MDIIGQIPLFLSGFVASTYPFVLHLDMHVVCIPMALWLLKMCPKLYIYWFASEISDIPTVASKTKPCPLVKSSVLNCCCV